MTEQEWISIDDSLPISGYDDLRYDPPFHEEKVQVKLDSGKVTECNFWCCWEVSINDDESNFIREFDIDEKITHWRRFE